MRESIDKAKGRGIRSRNASGGLWMFLHRWDFMPF
jgi:hypothetical protein